MLLAVPIAAAAFAGATLPAAPSAGAVRAGPGQADPEATARPPSGGLPHRPGGEDEICLTPPGTCAHLAMVPRRLGGAALEAARAISARRR